MKAVVLCGGTGSRLAPLTNIMNKHLLPVYNKPMLYYPIELLVKSGIRDILLVCGGNGAGEFLRIMGNGEQFGLRHLHYTYQAQPKGIADALSLAEEWADNQPITVILGDNIFQNDVRESIEKFEKNPVGAVIFGTEVDHPEHYGVIELGPDGKIQKIVEKPTHPVSKLISTGLYIYDNTVWDFIRQLSPSTRGELEITDVNNHYLAKNQLSVERLSGYWVDCGENFDAYLDAGIQVREWKKSS